MLLGKRRTEYGKRIRNGYENHTIKARRCEVSAYAIVGNRYCGAVTTVTHDNLILVINEKEKNNP